MASLSILIPVYNWDCSSLLEELHRQCMELGLQFEIIVADDCSKDRATAGVVCAVADSLEYCRFIGLTENISRAAIRNMLADQSRYDKLLFLDCDAAVKDSSFIRKYIDAAGNAQVVCGGAVHPDEMPEKGVELRYRYEKRADRERSAQFRSRNPYARFSPFSFLIDRQLFMSIRFDETYVNYGYEDVQLGRELEQCGATILHIDNPLVHLGLESNNLYLEKTRHAVRNALEHMDRIGDSSRLLNHYRGVLKWRMKWLFKAMWSLLGKPMERNLLSARPSLRVFSLYKLCYICSL